MKVKKIRKYLEKNKIFFEITSLTFLGLASLFVAILSYKVSKSELEILKLEHSPIIKVKREVKTEIIDHIKVYNIGYHLFDPKVEYTSFLEVKKFKDSTTARTNDLYFKILDYYSLNYETSNTTGEISTIVESNYKDDELNRIFDELFDISEEKKISFEKLKIEHLLRVSYKNQSKEQFNRYYKIDYISIIEISRKDYESLKQIIDSSYRKSSNQNRYLKTITGENLVEQMLEISKKINEAMPNDDDI